MRNARNRPYNYLEIETKRCMVSKVWNGRGRVVYQLLHDTYDILTSIGPTYLHITLHVGKEEKI